MFQPKWETEYFIICKGGQCSVFRLVQWKEVFQKRHAHNQNPKSTIVIIIIIVVVMQHKQIVPNPHKHHCHQSTPRWVNCVKTGWRWYWRHRELVFPKAYLFLGMCIWQVKPARVSFLENSRELFWNFTSRSRSRGIFISLFILKISESISDFTLFRCASISWIGFVLPSFWYNFSWDISK